jgi:hypothetical protein
MKPGSRTAGLRLPAAVALLLLQATGCSVLTAPFTPGYAAVEIKGATVEQIHSAAIAVFEDDGFVVTIPSQDRPVLEKLAPGNYQGAYRSLGGKPVDVRVKLSISRLSAGKYRLSCAPYVIRDNGDPYVEEEDRLSNMRIAPYQKLLDKVVALLNPPPVKPK